MNKDNINTLAKTLINTPRLSDFYFSPWSKLQFSASLEWNVGNLQQFEEDPEKVPCIFKAEDEITVVTPADDEESEPVTTLYKRQLYLGINVMKNATWQQLAPAMCFRIYKQNSEGKYELYQNPLWAAAESNPNNVFVQKDTITFEITAGENSISFKAEQEENQVTHVVSPPALNLALPELYSYALPFNGPVCWFYKNSGVNSLTKLNIIQMHAWQDNSADLFPVIKNEEDLRPYAVKQLPLQNLMAYYPLYYHFDSIVSSEDNPPLEKEMKDDLAAVAGFDTEALVFDSQQIRFLQPLTFIEDLSTEACWFTLSFWMKLDTESIVWLSETLEDILLFEIYNGNQSVFSVRYHYDEAELKPVFIAETADVEQELDGVVSEWVFFSLSYNKTSGRLFLTGLSENDTGRETAQKTLTFDSVSLDGSSLLCFGGSKNDAAFTKTAFSGRIMALSDITIFKESSFYEGLQNVFEDFTVHNIDNTDPHYNTTLLYLLFKGGYSPWYSFFSNYLKHKENNSIE
jgi:hypothetical protein